MNTIPVTNDASQTFRVVLGGQEVRLSFQWSRVASAWYVSIDGIISGARIQSGFPIIYNLRTSFVGDLIALPIITPATNPGRDAWGDTHTMAYLTPTEMEAFLNVTTV